MRYRQAVPALGLSLERGTEAAPDDGRYHVIHAGAVIFSSPSEKKALERYRHERDKLFAIHGRPQPEPWDRDAWLRQQRLDSDLRAMSNEWKRTQGAKSNRKGGKGGKGGVG